VLPACYFGLEYASNPLSAGASPQTPLGELTALPRPLAGFKRPTSKGRGRDGKGKGKKAKKGREGEEKGKERGDSFARQPLGCFRRLWFCHIARV